MLKLVTKASQIHRNVWGYVNIAFNKVDIDRLNIVGPERLCAEWIIKNGGAIRFTGNPKVLVKQYDLLSDNFGFALKIKEIDATDSSIMKLGFEHLKGCKAIDKIILNRCKLLENDSLSELQHVADTLRELHVISCYNMRDDGILLLKSFKNLKSLIIYDLPYVRDLNRVKDELVKEIPQCKIQLKPLVSDILNQAEAKK